MEGRQAHAARPHEGADALVAGAALVGEIQRFLAREVDPGEPAVITIGQMEAGVASNVVAGRARLRGTVRAQSTAMRSRLLEGLERLAAAVGAAHGVGIDCHVESGTPAVVNDAAAAALMRRAAADVVGEAGVLPLRRPNLAGEDFAFYLERTAGGFVRLGAQPRDWDGSGAHSGGFRIDEGVLAIGARYFHRLVHLACGR